MDNVTMENIKLDVRVYPLDDPQGNTKAFASVGIEDLAAIRGIRVVDGEKGLFVTMPQSQDNTGLYHDIAFPLSGDLRKEMSAAVLDEYDRQASLDPGLRGYEKPETNPADLRRAEDIKLDIRVFPIAEPKGDTLAFASVALDDVAAIRGIRVVNSEKGQFVSMPQSKDRNGEFHDIAFPLSGDTRRAISNAILSEYREMAAEKKHGIGERLAEGKEQASQQAAPARAVAKSHYAGALE